MYLNNLFILLQLYWEGVYIKALWSFLDEKPQQITSDLLLLNKLKEYLGLQVQNSANSSHPRAFIH